MAFLRSVDKHPPSPCRSTLNSFRDDEPAFLQLDVNLRQRPVELFGYLAALAPDRVPALCGLTLAPRPASALRRALHASGQHAALLTESQAETVVINMIRTHRWRAARHQVSQMFNRWLQHAHALSREVVPLLCLPRVAREIALTLNMAGAEAA